MWAKKYYLLLILGLFLSGIGYADNLANLNISFCTGGLEQGSGAILSGNALMYKLGADQTGNICYRIENKSVEDMTLKLSFVDGVFTNDQRRNKACLSDKDIKYFGQYVTGYEKILNISGMKTVQESANFRYPLGSDGVYHGCLVYSVVDTSKQGTGGAGNFSLLMRRAKFIDVLVGNHGTAQDNALVLLDFDPLSGENLSSNPKVRIYIDQSDGKYVIQFKIKNVSNIDQSLDITGIVSNFIAYKKIFTEPRILLRDETLLITKKLDEVPSFNLHTKVNISYVALDTFDGESPIVGNISTQSNILIVDTIFIISLVGLLLFIIILILLIKVLKNQKENMDKSTKHKK